MTREELRKEATMTVEWECTPMIDRPTFVNGYVTGSKSREQRIADLETQLDQLQRINNEQKETLKKVRVALIQERAANIMNYGKGGVEMFNSLFEILKDVSN